MKKIIIIVAVMQLILGLNLANASSDLNGRIRGIKVNLDSITKDTYKLTRKWQSKFPEYHFVYEDFLRRATSSVSEYKSDLDKLKREADKTLTQHNALWTVYKKNGCYKSRRKRRTNLCKGLKNSIEDSNKRITRTAKALSKTYGSYYRKFLSGGGGFSFPVKYKTTKRYRRELAKYLSWFVPLATILTAGVVTSLAVWGDSGFYEPSRHSFIERVLRKGGRFKLVYSNGESFNKPYDERTERLTSRKKIKRVLKERQQNAATDLFKMCNTAVCVHTYTELLISWYKKGRKMNKALELVKGVKLDKLKIRVSEKKVIKVLKRMAKWKAKQLPLASL